MRSDTWLDRLNPAQRRAALHAGGPLLILAGAGTGKTTTLAARLAVLLERRVPPERIGLLTFSRRAARLLLARAGELAEAPAAAAVCGGTFHAVAYRLLHRFGGEVGLPEGFTVLDAADSADLFGLLRAEQDVPATERRFPSGSALAEICSRVVNTRVPVDRVLAETFPWCASEEAQIRALLAGYTARKRARHLLDLDDLLLYWEALCLAGPPAGARFEHVLVDEYQDTNAAQAGIVAALARAGAAVSVVGDDAQAIYGFRGATVRNILDFESTFAGTTVVALEESYRSTAPVLAVANEVVAEAAEAFPKRLRAVRGDGPLPRLVTTADELGQAQEVCRAVLEARERGVRLGEQAVLFRTGHHSARLEVELTRRRIPFVKYGGFRFLESAHVRDVLALLRILQNPRDEVSWFRVLRLLDGVGPVTARRALGLIGPSPAPAASPLRAVAELANLPAGTREAVAGLDALLAAAPSAERAPAVELGRVYETYRPILRRRYDHAAARERDLEQLERLAAAAPSRERLLADLALDPPESTADLAGTPSLDEDYLVLSTVHSAKGGEWSVVHVINALDGLFPSDLSTGTAQGVEEERRLFYVALTRARDELSVHVPLRYHVRPGGRGDRHAWLQRSRFLSDAVVALLEPTVAGLPPGTPDALAGPDGPGTARGAAHVDAVLAGLW